jgi:hypothetical protein
VIGLSVLGPFPILKWMEWRAKEDAENMIRQQVPEAELQVFIDPSSDKNVVWEEDDEEFYYKGSLYDVVKKEAKDGKNFYYCYNDKNEALVFDGLQNFLYNQINDEHSATGAVHKYLLKTFEQVYLVSDKFVFSAKIAQEIKHRQHYFPSYYTAVFFEIISPPPELS